MTEPAAERLPVTALKHTHVLRGDGTVTVGVSVLRGAAREREDAIATVDVAMNQRSEVEALRTVGLAPLVLSLTALTPTTLYVPAVVNRTAGLEVTDVTVVSEPSPRYRITVRNLSAQAAIAFRVLTYRGDRLALSGMQGNRDASSIIDANGTYSFVLKPSSGISRPERAGRPPLHERIEIVAALWDDGSIEGAAGELTATLALYIGRRAELLRGLSALKALPSPAQPRQSKAWLAAQIEALSIEPDEDTVDGGPFPPSGSRALGPRAGGRDAAKRDGRHSPRDAGRCPRRTQMTDLDSNGGWRGSSAPTKRQLRVSPAADRAACGKGLGYDGISGRPCTRQPLRSRP